MHEIKLGRKGLKEAANDEKGCDLVGGYTETPIHIPIDHKSPILNNSKYCHVDHDEMCGYFDVMDSVICF